MRKDLIIAICLTALVLVVAVIVLPNQIPITPAMNNITVEQPETNITEQSTPLPGMKSGAATGKLSHNLFLNSSQSLDNGITKAGQKILVYRTIPPVVTKETTLAIARKFNVSGKLRGDTAVQSEDLSRSVEIIKKSGYVSYLNTKHTDETNSIYDPTELPSDEEAIQIATEFLKDRNLFPEDAVPVEVEHIKTERLNNKDNSKSVVWEKLAVWFGGSLNNIKVSGRSIRVLINADGEIIGYDANWRNYEPDKEYQIKTAGMAFDELKTRGVAVGINEPEMVSIDQVELAYNSMPGAYVEKYLDPVYVFRGRAMVNGKPVMSISEYVPALTDDAVKSLFPIIFYTCRG